MINKLKYSLKKSIVFPKISLLIVILLANIYRQEILDFKPVYQAQLESTLKGKNLISDVKEFLSNEVKDIALMEKILQSGTINGFMNYIEVNGILEFIFVNFPEKVKGFQSIGKTFQKRDIMAIRLGERNSKEKRNSIYSTSFSLKEEKEKEYNSVIMMTGAHHSRELLTQNMVVKMTLEHTHKLLHSTAKDLPYWKMTDLLLIPIVNVDGHKLISDAFNFDRDHSVEIDNIFFEKNKYSIPSFDVAKFKRKNMNDEFCKDDQTGVDIGVDLNRNYGFHWTHGEPEDSEECSEVFKGKFPFSESETASIRDLVEREKDFIVLILNFHTYGNLWVRPFNYSKERLLDHFQIKSHIKNFYQEMEQEILEVCPKAEVGNASKTVDYLSFGEASDWALGEHNIVAYSPELGYSDGKSDSFFIQRELINKALGENFLVIEKMLSKARFRLKSPKVFLNSANQFVIELDNPTLGKVFNSKILLRASNLKFFESISEVSLNQENVLPEKLEFSLFREDGTPQDPNFLNKSLYPQILEKESQLFLELELPQLNSLSKAELVFQLNMSFYSLETVHFNLMLQINDVHTVNQFSFSQIFGYNDTFKFFFFVILGLNLLAILLFIFFKCYQKPLKQNPDQINNKQTSLKKEKENGSALSQKP